MSTAVRFWWASLPAGWCCQRRRQPRQNCRIAAAWLPLFCLLWPTLLLAQPVAATNQNKAHQVLESAIQALGGQAWLDLRTIRTKGQMAAFFQGAPTGVLSDTTESTVLPDRQRIDLANGKVIQIYTGGHAWEITYKGKKPLSGTQMEDYLRWRDHSLGVALRRWFRDPGTILMDEGPSQVNRRVTEKIKLIDPANDAVTLEIDAESHLPLRLSYEWRDPRFHDKNLDTVEYDNYQRVDGIAMPFTVTRMRNGETVGQSFLRSVQYNLALPKDFFNPDIAAAHLK